MHLWGWVGGKNGIFQLRHPEEASHDVMPVGKSHISQQINVKKRDKKLLKISNHPKMFCIIFEFF